MTPTELLHATWVPHPVPAEPHEELMAPWMTVGHRVLVCVKTDEGVFVIARRGERITECWKVAS